MDRNVLAGIAVLFAFLIISGCSEPGVPPPGPDGGDVVDRETRIPAGAVKVTEETDEAPVKSLSPDYHQPVPLPYPVNTAGAEDSAFVMPDGGTLYFFFTPDAGEPAERQVMDGVTGIYVARKAGGGWQRPERVLLQDRGKLALDGCEFVLGNRMWFCTVREGLSGIHWFTATLEAGNWTGWRNADAELKRDAYQMGELHISGDGNELYFHADDRGGGKGGRDIWMSRNIGGAWGEPVNVETVNTERDEGYPALSPDGRELWITRDYGIWRSRKAGGAWQAPELIFSPLAGEASIDNRGNVYFTHHFFRGDTMIEADIYLAYRK